MQLRNQGIGVRNRSTQEIDKEKRQIKNKETYIG